MPVQRPSVGDVVHYVSHGTPIREDGSQAYASECRAAVITAVGAWVDLAVTAEPAPYDGAQPHRVVRQMWEPSTLALNVLNPTGQFFNERVPHHAGDETLGDPDCVSRASHGNPLRYCSCGWMEPHLQGGTWHWPARG